MSNYNNEFKKHKASDMIKWIVVFILILALMASVAMIGLKVFGVIGKDKPAEDPAAENVDVDPKSALFNYETQGISVKRMALTASGSPTANTSKTQRFTATVEPAEAAQEVDWALSFKNPSSEWATGKDINEYAQISVDGSNSCICDFTLKQAFGEQIILKASAKSDETKFCDVTIDYAMPVSFTSSDNNSFARGNLSNITESSYIAHIKEHLIYGLGTYKPQDIDISVEFLLGGYGDSLRKKDIASGAVDCRSFGSKISSLAGFFFTDGVLFVDSDSTLYNLLFEDSSGLSNATKNIINRCIEETGGVTPSSDHFVGVRKTLFFAHITFEYCGITRSDFACVVKWIPKMSYYPENVSVDSQSVLFGEADSE